MTACLYEEPANYGYYLPGIHSFHFGPSSLYCGRACFAPYYGYTTLDRISCMLGLCTCHPHLTTTPSDARFSHSIMHTMNRYHGPKVAAPFHSAHPTPPPAKTDRVNPSTHIQDDTIHSSTRPLDTHRTCSNGLSHLVMAPTRTSRRGRRAYLPLKAEVLFLVSRNKA
jgi:hypothetical protein